MLWNKRGQLAGLFEMFFATIVILLLLVVFVMVAGVIKKVDNSVTGVKVDKAVSLRGYSLLYDKYVFAINKFYSGQLVYVDCEEYNVFVGIVSHLVRGNWNKNKEFLFFDMEWIHSNDLETSSVGHLMSKVWYYNNDYRDLINNLEFSNYKNGKSWILSSPLNFREVSYDC